jgi:hypothetical protein
MAAKLITRAKAQRIPISPEQSIVKENPLGLPSGKHFRDAIQTMLNCQSIGLVVSDSTLRWLAEFRERKRKMDARRVKQNEFENFGRS